MSNYKKYAIMEFQAAGWCNADGKFNNEMQEMICNHVIKLLEVFANEGHSGNSAPYAINLFKQLAMFEPIVPLTGEDFEWVKISSDTWQNNRCSHVLRDANGRAYDINGKVFERPDGCCYTSKDSRVYITFPYMPKTEYVKVAE